MNQKKFVIDLIILLLITSFFTSFEIIEFGRATEPRFYVDDDYDSSTPGWGNYSFNRIQDAINLSSPEDRIIVLAGTYTENLIINVSLDLFAEDKDITIIDGGSSGDVITINAEYVNLSTFTIKKSGTSSNNAVIKINQGYCKIIDNIITTGGHGISINNCNYNMIYDNTIQNNGGDGIRLNNSNNNDITYITLTNNANGISFYNSSDNTIEYIDIKNNNINGIFMNDTCDTNSINYNNFSDNDENGIFLIDHCDYNTLTNNEFYSNSYSGIRLENSSINTLNNNIINSNTKYGIFVLGSLNMIQENTIYSNGASGVFLFSDDNNIISNNTINSNSEDGIRSQNSTNDSIYNNKIFKNTEYGINLNYYAVDNLIHNNMFYDNTNNAMDQSIMQNSWNDTKTSGTNIIGGPNLSGNFWDDYTGLDSDNDGIGDTSYTIHTVNKDNGPLVDVTSPVITSVQVSPSSQTVGSLVTITTTITDNVGVQGVHVIATGPDSQTYNFSIIGNKTGNSYSLQYAFSPVGNYIYYIRARDTRNWVSSALQGFQIHEGLPPTIVDNSPDTGSPSSSFIFNATVTDDTDPAINLTVKINWTHGSNSGNDTLSNTYGNYWEKTVTLDSNTNDLVYNFYASDHWGNTRITTQTTVSIVDNEPPNIVMNRWGPSFDDMPNSYTYNATITDNTEVSNVSLEYWYENSNHRTVTMDNTDGDYYEQILIIHEIPEQVYSIITATDITGNQNDTKNPHADANGPYDGVITIPITFNGTGSYDLDGNITSYSWNFGDGSTGNGTTPAHTYPTDGNYTVILTVTDNDENTDVSSTYANIIPLFKEETSTQILNQLEEDYNIILVELFFSYDTDGDEIVDAFFDPNNVLTCVHNDNIGISDDICFLISIDDSTIPEFFWNSTADTITPVSHKLGTIDETYVDEENGNATVYVIVNKTNGWIYIEVTDQYPDASLTVKTGDRTIASDRVWRLNEKVYILDDPEREYILIYEDLYQPPELEHAVFSPEEDGVIDQDNPTITITYNVPVTIKYADFYNINILESDIALDMTGDLVTTDNQIYSYTPPSDLEDGRYRIDILVEDENGNEMSDTIVYNYFSYTEESSWLAGLPIPLNWLILIIAAAVLAAIIIVAKKKNISLNGFIYINKRKILPFFKPVVIGPVSINVDDSRINKAEFYLDGKLNETIANPPFIWEWNERSFSKHKLETKIYDEEGNSSSSGELEFYIFNSSKRPK